MTFKPAVWYPIALVLSVVNVAGAWLAAGPARGHMSRRLVGGRARRVWPVERSDSVSTHAALAVAFGLWAQRLRLRRRAGGDDVQGQLDALEAEVVAIGQELTETQERLDFTERMLMQEREMRRVDPPHRVQE